MTRCFNRTAAGSCHSEARKLFTWGCAGGLSHEDGSHVALSRHVARLLRCDYAGRLEDSEGEAGIYCVPRQTLHGEDGAAHWCDGPFSEAQFLGGWVPHPLLATKGIVHPLADGEVPPPHWPLPFTCGISDLVLPGVTAFTVAGVVASAQEMLRGGPVRLKSISGSGGKGQHVVADEADLRRVLQSMKVEEGVVLEQNLSDARTYSVGQVTVGETRITYVGTQEVTQDNAGETAYGGSTLTIVRGGFPELLAASAPETESIIALAVGFDRMADRHLSLRASRRNYDVITGRDMAGRCKCAVLEQSWRVGGATGAELAAVEAFLADPALQRVTASTVERYGVGATPPPGATVYFHGTDPVIGPILKYAFLREDS